MSTCGEDKSNRIQGDHKGKKFPGGQNQKHELESQLVDMIETHLYVLNHSVQRIHLETFFFFAGGLLALAVASLLGTTSADIAAGVLGFSSTFSLTSPKPSTVMGPD